jgi:hypothetical protein
MFSHGDAPPTEVNTMRKNAVVRKKKSNLCLKEQLLKMTWISAPSSCPMEVERLRYRSISELLSPRLQHEVLTASTSSIRAIFRALGTVTGSLFGLVGPDGSGSAGLASMKIKMRKRKDLPVSVILCLQLVRSSNSDKSEEYEPMRQ